MLELREHHLIPARGEICGVHVKVVSKNGHVIQRLLQHIYPLEVHQNQLIVSKQTQKFAGVGIVSPK